MAIIEKWDDEQKRLWSEWLETRPQIIRDMAERIKPNVLYRLKSSGHRVFPVSYNENGTVTVAVTGEFNRVFFERHVFGISQDDLEECELPLPSETLGSMQAEMGLTDDEAIAIARQKIATENN